MNFVASKDTAIRVLIDAPTMINASLDQTSLEIVRDGTSIATLAAMPPATATATVDFVCPSRATCGDWAAGSYVFNASVNGVKQSTQGTTYNFALRASLRILVRPVKSNFAGTITQVRGDAWKTAWAFTRRVYPIGADQILWETREEFDASAPMFDLETDDGRAALWTALTNLMPEHCAANPKGKGCYDLIVGFISDRPKTYPNGTLQGYTYGRPTNIVVASDEDMPATIAHEIGHIYGLGDTYDGGSLNCAVNPSPDGFSGKNFNDSTQTTSCTAGRVAFPGSGATLIPAANRAYEVEDRGSLGDRADFMGSGTVQANYWITPEAYNQIFSGLAPAAVPSASVKVRAAAAATPQKLLFFEGSVNAGGSTRIQPWYAMTSIEAVTDTVGDTQIQAVDASGKVLATQAINPKFFVLAEPPVTVDYAPFMGAIRFPDGVARFQIVQKGNVLYDAKVSANDPVVSAVYPASPGSTLDGPQTITWAAQDADGDSLKYLVEYNPNPQDPASDWEVLAANITATQWQDDFGTLPGSAAAAIRITATDGIRSGSALSQPFAVSLKPPAVFINALTNTTFKQSDQIRLNGEAEDLQDGTLEGMKLAWSSDVAGAIGTGGEIVTRLAKGTHNITLTATNSAGLTGSQTLQIQVQ